MSVVKTGRSETSTKVKHAIEKEKNEKDFGLAGTYMLITAIKTNAKKIIVVDPHFKCTKATII